jgi:hypothetical protein
VEDRSNNNLIALHIIVISENIIIHAFDLYQLQSKDAAFFAMNQVFHVSSQDLYSII